MVGVDYTVPCKLTESDEGIITLEGEDYGIYRFLDKIGFDNMDMLNDPKDLNIELTNPMFDLSRNPEVASFGTCKSKSKFSFKLR